jgi:CheY-like chemotaxis protein
MSKLKILIVDDSQSNLFSLEALIEEHIDDVEILQAESGKLALETLQQNPVDVIILDIQMPEMDGFQVAKLIREQKSTQNLPIIFITAAYDSDEFQKQGITIEMMEYLTKPFEPEKLINILKSYMK